jgi:superfamily II DNA or RNA helicase
LVSKRLEHLSILEDLLHVEGFRDPIYKLTGKDSTEDREYAVQALSAAPALLLSTLADEALDIPRLDRIHLPFPQKNTGLITQQVGRVEREHPGKVDAIIFDYVDGNVGPLEKQWKGRRFEVYEPRGYKIERRKVQT